jgi:hypothetical protein
MLKNFLLYFGALAIVTALVVSGCGGSDEDASTACEANLPCAVSTNIN